MELGLRVNPRGKNCGIVLGTVVSEDGNQVTTYGLKYHPTVIGNIALSEQEITEFAEQLNCPGVLEIYVYEPVETFRDNKTAQFHSKNRLGKEVFVFL